MIETTERPSSRRRFLRQLTLSVGAGIGVLALPAAARADVWLCCPNTSQCTNDCGTGQVRYLCRCSEHGGSDYCTHCQPSGNCYNGPC